VSISSSWIAPLSTPGLPGVVFLIGANFRHHFFGEQFQRVADMLVDVLAGPVSRIT